MTIGAWISFVVIAVTILVSGYAIAHIFDAVVIRAIIIVLTFAIIIAVLGGMFWYFNNTASGARAMVDQKSNIGKGLDRIVRVYTANGDVIAEYKGHIDIEANDGGYIKFDFEGKRYMYYNCFVESIADIK